MEEIICQKTEYKIRFKNGTEKVLESLCNANLGGADLCNVNLQGANLCNANLHNADLDGANLCNANLQGAYLVDTVLYNADLRGANLCKANLNDANLFEANLEGANLHYANLCNANLCNANLHGVKLYATNLCGTQGIDPNELGIIIIQSGKYPATIHPRHRWVRIGCFYGSFEDALVKRGKEYPNEYLFEKNIIEDIMRSDSTFVSKDGNAPPTEIISKPISSVAQHI